MSKESAQGSGSGREPIRMAELKFLPCGQGVPSQSGPSEGGLGGAPSAIRSSDADPKLKRIIEHLPWLRQYRITDTGTGVAFRIHEHRIEWAVTLEEWQAANKLREERKGAK